jgi:Na+/proline symporter/signal transduction histidine kinase
VFSPITVISAMFAYIALLFILAQVGERTRYGRKLASHPFTYALGLAVYCTTWTYYGSVGKASTGGMGYLPVYLGPTLALLVGGSVFQRIARLKHAHRITSIADFISARFAKSQAVAALVTVILTIGIIPYIALQLKSATTTFSMLVAGGSGESSTLAQSFGPISVVLMIVFTIVFGIRHLDPTERHPGMVVSLAVESFVKLVAFVAAGAFVVGAAFHGYDGFEQALGNIQAGALPLMGQSSANDTLTYVTVMLLSMAAFAFLPRQFHVGVVENNRPEDVKTAQWLTPLYLVLINLFVVPIAIGGKLLATAGTSADFYVLALPLQAGKTGLSLAVFLGGFSAAIGMIMIESMTMATMISNHLLLPAVQAIRKLHFLRRYVLFMRWAAAAGFISGGYLFAVEIGSAYPLVAIGLISFAAAFLLAPVVLLGLYWRGANRAGALLGLSTGATVWFFTLMVPTFVKAGWVDKTLLTEGLFGFGLLRPEALFGWVGLPGLAHGVMWSSFATVLGLVGGSALFRSSKAEALLTDAFLGDASQQLAHLDGSGATIDVALQLDKVRPVVAPYFSEQEARQLLERALAQVVVSAQSKMTVVQCAEFMLEVERMLAGALGSASAHGVMDGLGGFERKDKATLQREFARTLASLKMSPKDLKARIDFQKEREGLLQEQHRALEQKINERDNEILERKKAELALRKAHDQLEQRVIERTQELRSILDNVVFGFLVIDKQLVIQPGFTQSCRELLGTEDVAGRDIGDVLGLDPYQCEFYRMGIEQVFEGFLPEDAAIDQVQQRFVSKSGQVLRVEPRVVHDDAGQAALLLLTISDITPLENARHENEGNRALLNILRHKPAFELFLNETKEQLLMARQSAGDDVLVRRVAHTIKGNASSYGLSPIERLVHEIEERPQIEPAALDSIADAFRSFLASHSAVLGLDFDQALARSFALTEVQLRRLRLALEAVPPSAEAARVAQLLAELEGVRAHDLLGPMDQFVAGLAERMGKRIDFELTGADVLIDVSRMGPLFHTLPHLIRNAVDHGIEPVDGRGTKPDRASLRLEVRQTDEHCILIVQDDGRGIDAALVLEKAIARGMTSEGEAKTMTPAQIVELVFRDGISTAEDVTDISGRGVGMSAVKAEVQRLGGQIAIKTELGKGTRVELTVPRAPRTGAPSRTPSRSDKLSARPRDTAASIEAPAVAEDIA